MKKLLGLFLMGFPFLLMLVYVAIVANVWAIIISGIITFIIVGSIRLGIKLYYGDE